MQKPEVGVLEVVVVVVLIWSEQGSEGEQGHEPNHCSRFRPI